MSTANIAALRKALEGFHPHASPDLMRELEEAVDRHEKRVNTFLNPEHPDETNGIVKSVSAEEKREPLMSDEELTTLSRNAMAALLISGVDIASDECDELVGEKAVRDWYEAKIASGELRVVKKVKDVRGGDQFECSGCDTLVEDPAHGVAIFNFCPGCGAQIVKE